MKNYLLKDIEWNTVNPALAASLPKTVLVIDIPDNSNVDPDNHVAPIELCVGRAFGVNLKGYVGRNTDSTLYDQFSKLRLNPVHVVRFHQEDSCLNNMKTHTIVHITAPMSWKRLIDVEFQRGEDGKLYRLAGGIRVPVKPISEQKDIADPTAYYDDLRLVGTTWGDVEVFLELCSGQGNYYAVCTIKNDGTEVYKENWEWIDDDSNSVVGRDGNEYHIVFDWVD